MNNSDIEIEREFDQARRARENGNEGQARVCARRAAGIAIRDFLNRRGIRQPNPGAYELLNSIKENPLLPPDLKLAANHLTLRVTEEFNLPVQADLIAEAETLCAWLLKN